jgi:hypothetical protein
LGWASGSHLNQAVKKQLLAVAKWRNDFRCCCHKSFGTNLSPFSFWHLQVVQVKDEAEGWLRFWQDLHTSCARGRWVLGSKRLIVMQCLSFPIPQVAET